MSFPVGVQIFFEGKVQGVGFRACVKREARGFDVIGWVRNLPDGRVELQACGDREEVMAFVEAIRESELKGHIRKEECHWGEAFACKGFEILR
jgi:acylphosphatase